MLPIVVLAGGLATRLRPVTETIPKSLIHVNGQPFVLHQLELFKQKGIKDIFFCLGYLGEQVEKVVTESPFAQYFNISFFYDGDILLGTGGAIRKNIEHLPSSFFVTYGDSYLDVNYVSICQHYLINKRNEDDALMTVFNNEGKWDTSNVEFEDGTIKLYSKHNKNPRMQFIDYGLNILTRNNFEAYPTDFAFGLEEIQEKLSLQKKLIGYEVKQRFYEVGSFAGINDLEFFLNK